MKQPNATASHDNANEIIEGLLRYFNHLWGFIEGGNNAIGSDQKTKWRTERRFKLDEATFYRRFTSVNELIGIRFNTGKDWLTNYLMLDIDRHSANHPFNNPDNFKRLLEAFEDAGLPTQILVKSSDSWGLHLYTPLSKGMHVFTAACWLEKIVKNAGFTIEQGQLECFPNAKRRSADNKITLYNGHRLPLQPDSGSMLLDDELNPISDNFLDFVAQMDFVATHKNIVDEEMEAEAALARDAITKERIFKSKNGKSIIDEWIADLLAYHQVGWTSIGQTNNLLCKFACYGRVFLGLEGEDLVQYVINIARNAPGYQEHCQHKHEIEKRARDRANGAMKYYWKLGDVAKRESTYLSISGQKLENVCNGNEAKAYNAVERLEAALARVQTFVTAIKNNKTEFYLLVKTTSEEMFGTGISKATFYKKNIRPIWEKVFMALVVAGQVATTAVAEPAPVEPPYPTTIAEETSHNTEDIAPTIEPEELLEEATEIAETPANSSQFRPCSNSSTVEPPKTAVNKDSLDLPIYEGLCKRAAQPPEKLKKSSPQSSIGSAAEPPATTPKPAHERSQHSKPILKSQQTSQSISSTNQLSGKNARPRPKIKHKQDLSIERHERIQVYLVKMAELHRAQVALETARSRPEYQNVAKASFAAIRRILNAAKATLKRGDSSPPT